MIWNDGLWESPDPIADRERDERDEYETSLDLDDEIWEDRQMIVGLLGRRAWMESR